LRRLHQFAAVADCGTFTRAADTLHLSQQALSSSVRRLETEQGTALFRRDGRRITLTPAGHTAAPLTTGAVALVTSDARPAMSGGVVLVELTPPLSEVRNVLMHANTREPQQRGVPLL
jgi:hypothetical protein